MGPAMACIARAAAFTASLPWPVTLPPRRDPGRARRVGLMERWEEGLAENADIGAFGARRATHQSPRSGDEGDRSVVACGEERRPRGLDPAIAGAAHRR